MAVQIDATSTKQNAAASSASSVTTSGAQNGTGTNRYALVLVVAFHSGAVSISTVTLGGTSMGAAVLTETGTTNAILALYGRVAPTSGASEEAAATFGGSYLGVGIAILHFENVDQTTPVNSSAKTSVVASTSITRTLSSATGRLCVDGVLQAANTTLTVQSGQTQEHNVALFAGRDFGMSREAGSASVTMGWDFGASTSAAMGMVDLLEATGGGGDPEGSLVKGKLSRGGLLTNGGALLRRTRTGLLVPQFAGEVRGYTQMPKAA